MKFINSWNSKSKQFDKIEIEIRLSIVTLFSLYVDFSKKEFKLCVMNFAIKNK
jgi:hypothetical protein